VTQAAQAWKLPLQATEHQLLQAQSRGPSAA